MKKHKARNKRGIRIVVYSLIAVVAFFVVANYLISASAQVTPPPPTSRLSIEDLQNGNPDSCLFYFYSANTYKDSTTVVNQFRTVKNGKTSIWNVVFDGKIYDRVDISGSSNLIKIKDNSVVPNTEGDTIYFYLIPKVHVNGGNSSSEIQKTVIEDNNVLNGYIYKNNGANSGEIAIKNGSSTIGLDPITGGNSTVFSAYLSWLYNNFDQGKCHTKKGPPTGTNQTKYFDPIDAKGLNGDTRTVGLANSLNADDKYYYVAKGNYQKSDGTLKLTGYIYRNNNKYVMIDDAGVIIANYTGDAIGKNWDNTLSATVNNFKPPKPIISNSETVYHIKLPGNLGTDGSQFKAVIDPPIIDSGFVASTTGINLGDLNGLNKNVTIEAQLVDGNGPYLVKNLININDTNKNGIYKESDLGGFSGTFLSSWDIYTLTEEDLKQLYGATTHSTHSDTLVKNIVVCIHKKLNNNKYVSGSTTLKIPDDFKVAKDQTGGVFDWTGKESLYNIQVPAKDGSTCGTVDETSVIENLLTNYTPTPSAYDTIMQAILNAFKSLAFLIQRAIINVAIWVIMNMSNSIPI